MKERLNSDGQTSPAIPTKGKATFHFKAFDTKRPRHMTLDILVLVYVHLYRLTMLRCVCFNSNYLR
jgi:hypothetical protein